MTKKILFIAYYFAPLMHTATIRSLKFTKYLPDFDWEPHILTIDPIMRQQKWDIIDKNLLNEVSKNSQIYTTLEFDPLGIGRFLIKGRTQQASKDTANKKSGTVIAPTAGWLRKLSRAFKYWIAIPDNNIGWYPFAVRQGLKIIRNENIDVIFTTSGPYTAHLIGLKLKQLTGKPWIADFRDNWTRNSNIQYPTSIHRRIHASLEERVFLKADKITTVQPDVYDPDNALIDKNKFVHLINGVDEADFTDIKRTPPEKFTITYTGSFYGTRTPKYFFQGMAKLIEENPTLRSKIQIRILGRSYHVNINEMAAELGLTDIIQLEGVVPHKVALQAMVDTDVLLLVLLYTGNDSDKTVYTAKLFEYLQASRPILALILTDGVAADIIRKTGSGVVVPSQDVPAIKTALHTLYKQWEAGTLNVASNRDLTPYSRRGLTQKLATILNQVTHK